MHHFKALWDDHMTNLIDILQQQIQDEDASNDFDVPLEELKHPIHEEQRAGGFGSSARH